MKHIIILSVYCMKAPLFILQREGRYLNNQVRNCISSITNLHSPLTIDCNALKTFCHALYMMYSIQYIKLIQQKYVLHIKTLFWQLPSIDGYTFMQPYLHICLYF